MRPRISKPAGLAAFGYREYRLFWLAAAFSNIGMWALINGRLWLMHELTSSPLMLGLVTLTSLSPILALSLWGGVVADRVNRLRLVTTTRGMFSALAILTGVLILTDGIQPWHVLAISLATGILLSFDIPARQAIMPSLVATQHLAGAIAMYSFVTTGSAVLGPVVFAPLVRAAGLEGLFFIIGGAYAATVLVLLLMKPVALTLDANRGNLWRGLVEGLKYVRGHRTVRSLIGMGIGVGIFGASYQTLLPLFADEVLGGDIDDFGGLLLGAGIGAMLGAIILASVSDRRWLPRLLLIAGLGFGTALIVFSRVTWFPASVVAITFIGASAALFTTTNSTLVQLSVADGFRGRVMSLHQWSWGSTALGGLLLGSLAEALGAPAALTLGGTVTATVVGVVCLSVLRWMVFGPGEGPASQGVRRA